MQHHIISVENLAYKECSNKPIYQRWSVTSSRPAWLRPNEECEDTFNLLIELLHLGYGKRKEHLMQSKCVAKLHGRYSIALIKPGVLLNWFRYGHFPALLSLLFGDNNNVTKDVNMDVVGHSSVFICTIVRGLLISWDNFSVNVDNSHLVTYNTYDVVQWYILYFVLLLKKFKNNKMQLIIQWTAKLFQQKYRHIAPT